MFIVSSEGRQSTETRCEWQGPQLLETSAASPETSLGDHVAGCTDYASRGRAQPVFCRGQ